MYQPTPAEVEADKASAVAEAVEDLTYGLAAGWGLVAYFLADESWIAGIAVAVGLYWLVRRPFMKRYDAAWAKVTKQNAED